MTLVRTCDVLEGLKAMEAQTRKSLELGVVDGKPLRDKDRPFVRAFARGIRAARIAVAGAETVDLFAGPGILN